MNNGAFAAQPDIVSGRAAKTLHSGKKDQPFFLEPVAQRTNVKGTAGIVNNKIARFANESGNSFTSVKWSIEGCGLRQVLSYSLSLSRRRWPPLA